MGIIDQHTKDFRWLYTADHPNDSTVINNPNNYFDKKYEPYKLFLTYQGRLYIKNTNGEKVWSNEPAEKSYTSPFKLFLDPTFETV